MKKAVVLVRKYRLYFAGAIIAAVLLAPAYYFYNKYTSLEMQLKNPGKARLTSTNELVKKVGAHIQLPKDETPQLVTVSNKEKLAGLPFFKNAQNGDRVLLYKTSKMAYLYRPSTDQVINAAPIVDPGAAMGDTGAKTGNAPTAIPQPVKIAVYNGTTIAGYGKVVAAKVQEAVKQASIADVANAADQTRVKTLVIDLTGKNKSVAADLAKSLGGGTGPLPAGEHKPDADVLVIAGK
jgi:hypothetical protein